MSVSIGNQLYDTFEKDNKLYYFHEDIWKKFDYEAASDAVLADKAEYVFEIIKHPHGFTSEQILIQSNQRKMSKIEYNFVPREPVGEEN
tara:strand:- start:1594 stop:1860 length:267 start_codon:yes stop_codon:yes gene_type:complete